MRNVEKITGIFCCNIDNFMFQRCNFAGVASDEFHEFNNTFRGTGNVSPTISKISAKEVVYFEAISLTTLFEKPNLCRRFFVSSDISCAVVPGTSPANSISILCARLS